MQLGEISFCDKTGYNIKLDDFKKKVLDEIYEKYQCRIIQKHHDRFDFVHHQNGKSKLARVPHLLSTRTNGNPYFLYLTKCNFANQCIFIDKKVQQGYFYPRMIVVKLWFDESLFQGTIFDGEMVKTTQSTWEFIINDTLALRGASLYPQNLVVTLNKTHQTLRTSYVQDSTTCCLLKIKKYFKYEELDYLLDFFIPRLHYTCRGIYFKPLFKKFKDILFEFDSSLIKKVNRTKMTDIHHQSFLLEKHTQPQPKTITTPQQMQPPPPSPKPIVIPFTESEHEQCFLVRKTATPDVYELYAWRDNSDKNAQIACIPNMKTSKMMQALFMQASFLEKKKMRCVLHPKFARWVPVESIENCNLHTHYPSDIL